MTYRGERDWEIKGADGTPCDEVCENRFLSGCHDCPIQTAFDRLAAYEDTGLEPEEIDSVFIHGVIEENQRIKELAQAEKDGRLVVLPLKVVDMVWTNIEIVGDRYKSADRPYPVEVVFIGFGEGKRFFHVQYSNGRVFPFDFEQVGKTVFLTREEAEAALKKREEAENEAD